MNPLRAGRAGASLLVTLVVVTGCTGPWAGRETVDSAAARPPTCAVDRLVVSAGYDGVRVKNPSANACRFSGRHPVEMLVWRLDGAAPPVATGVLPAGATYVQPYDTGAGNGCPVSTEWNGAVTVYVEGVAVPAPQPGHRAHEIANCVSFTARPPWIER
jgi:hypothetical protein